MAVGIAAAAVEATIGTIQTLDDPGALEGLEVLVDGGVADVAALGVEALEDVAGAQVSLSSQSSSRTMRRWRERRIPGLCSANRQIHPVGLAVRCGVGCWVSSHDLNRSLKPL